MRVVEKERVESGEGLGRKVLATESTDSTEGYLYSPVSYREEQDCGSGLWIFTPQKNLSSLWSDQLLQEVLWLRKQKSEVFFKYDEVKKYF